MTQHASLTEPLLQAAALEKGSPPRARFLAGPKANAKSMR